MSRLITALACLAFVLLLIAVFLSRESLQARIERQVSEAFPHVHGGTIRPKEQP